MNGNVSRYLVSTSTKTRNLFEKRWRNVKPTYTTNLQQRYHGASVGRLFHPSLIEAIGTHETGPEQSLDWRLHFSAKKVDNPLTTESVHNKDNNYLSPWHDIPLGFKDTHLKTILYHYVNEIPKGGRAKIECATKEMWNPMKQDVKKGALRFFKYGDLPFNYGFIPQTFEDPSLESKYNDISGLKGDGDPIDVVEISDSLTCGVIVPIKILSVLGLIDEGEADWKIIAIRADHPKALQINTIDDACEVLGKDYKALILDWFENYKVPDGKPQNKFSHNKRYQSHEMGIQIIEECHHHWFDLLSQGTPTEKSFCLESAALKQFIAEGLTGKSVVHYPKYPDLNWAESKLATIDQKKRKH